MQWSWSAYNDYGTCPQKYYRERVLKEFRQQDTKHTLWGKEVHLALELAVRDGTALPERMKQYQSVVDALRRAPGVIHCELPLAVNQELVAVENEAPDAWCRGYADYVAINDSRGLALDYKTGKRKVTDQLKLMALLAFAKYPQIQEFITGFVWLADNNRIDKKRFSRENMGPLWGDFEVRLRQMEDSFEHDVWPAKKNGLCKAYCPVASCPHNGNFRRFI